MFRAPETFSTILVIVIPPVFIGISLYFMSEWRTDGIIRSTNDNLNLFYVFSSFFDAVFLCHRLYIHLFKRIPFVPCHDWRVFIHIWLNRTQRLSPFRNRTKNSSRSQHLQFISSPKRTQNLENGYSLNTTLR